MEAWKSRWPISFQFRSRLNAARRRKKRSSRVNCQCHERGRDYGKNNAHPQARPGAPIFWTRAIHHLLRFEVTPRTLTFILLLHCKLSLIYESASSSISSGLQIMWHGAYNLLLSLWKCELKGKLFLFQLQHLLSLLVQFVLVQYLFL